MSRKRKTRQKARPDQRARVPTQVTLRREHMIYMRLLVIVAALYIAFITAYVGDDARISLRQVWNFINGDGMTFNVGDRVQAFSHPTWFLLLSFVTAITRELSVTTLMVSISLSSAAVALLLAVERRAPPLVGKSKLGGGLTPVLLLFFSYAFCEYMTSGLENPLSYFLVGLLLWFIATDKLAQHTTQHLTQHRRWMFLIMALLVLNRFDYAALFLPLAILLSFTSSSDANRSNISAPSSSFTKLRQALKDLMRDLANDVWPGAAVLLAWFAFSLVYFGAPFPNTFYAKMATGYPLAEVLERAVNYYVATLKNDTISLVIILVGLLLSLANGSRVLLALAAGQLLYTVFLLSAGGSHMEGRFFAVPVYLSVGQIILALASKGKVSLQPFRPWIVPGLLLLGLGLGIGAPRYPFMATTGDTAQDAIPGATHVVNLRLNQYPRFGLLSRNREAWPQIVDQPEEFPKYYKIDGDWLGETSWSGPGEYLIDDFALADPFLARLPAIQHEGWRVDHHFRKPPTDYGNYMVGKVKELPDQSLNGLARDVLLAIRGDLFTRERFAAIWRLNTGHYSDVDMSKYADPTIYVPVQSSDTMLMALSLLNSSTKPDGYAWFQSGVINFDRNLHIEVDQPQRASYLQLSLGRGHAYEIYVNGNLLTTIPASEPPLGIVLNHTLRLPKPMVMREVEIRAMSGKGKYVLGHLHLR
ncbi:MAG: hypothetical protein ACR2PR_01755 [Pseudohongiellaceae bacterium]